MAKETTKENISVQIKPRIILFVLLTVGLVLLALELRQVILILFIAFILNSALRPVVDRLEKYKVNRVVAIILIYLVIFLLTALILGVIANELLKQVSNLINAIPTIYAGFANFAKDNLPFLSSFIQFDKLQPGIDELITSITQQDFFKNLIADQGLPAIQRAVAILGALFGGLISAFSTLMVTFYMLQRSDRVQEGPLALLPDKQEKFVRKVLDKVEESLGAWVVGQMALMLIIGVITYFVVLIPGLFVSNYTLGQFALPIALLAGLLEALPSIGPLVTMIIAGIIAAGTGGVGPLLYVIVSFFLIQNLEAVLIVPQVMKRVVGIDPIVTILGIIGAFEIGGVIAAILAVPVIAVVQITVLKAVEESRE